MSILSDLQLLVFPTESGYSSASPANIEEHFQLGAAQIDPKLACHWLFNIKSVKYTYTRFTSNSAPENKVTEHWDAYDSSAGKLATTPCPDVAYGQVGLTLALGLPFMKHRESGILNYIYSFNIFVHLGVWYYANSGDVKASSVGGFQNYVAPSLPLNLNYNGFTVDSPSPPNVFHTKLDVEVLTTFYPTP